jgi:hypothetical protein
VRVAKRRVSFREFGRWMQFFEERNAPTKPEFKEGSVDSDLFNFLNSKGA